MLFCWRDKCGGVICNLVHNALLNSVILLQVFSKPLSDTTDWTNASLIPIHLRPFRARSRGRCVGMLRGFSKMYHNYSSSQRFQKLIFQRGTKIPKIDLSKCSKIPRFIQTYPTISKTSQRLSNLISDLLGFTWIPISSKMFQDLQDFIEIPPCWFSVFLFNDR